MSVRAKPRKGARWMIVSTISPRLDADVERDADVVLELRLRAAERGQRRDRRQLSRPVVEPVAAVDVPVPELDHVAREVGGRRRGRPRSRARPARRPARAGAPSPVRTDRRTAELARPRRLHRRPTRVLLLAAVDDHDDALARSIREAEELLEIEEADAWFEYLEVDAEPVGDALPRGRALGLGPPQPAPPRPRRPPREAEARNGRLSPVLAGRSGPRPVGPCPSALSPAQPLFSA